MVLLNGHGPKSPSDEQAFYHRQMEYRSLDEYYAAQTAHPGFPSDSATLHHEGRPYRLMVLSDSHDIVLERVGGGWVQSLGSVEDPEVVDAILDQLWARHELAGTQLGLTEAVTALKGRPQDAAGEQALVALYRERQEQAHQLLKEARRDSYAVVPLSSLPPTRADALHRRDQVDYAGAGWQRLSRIAVAYLEAGHDPLDSFAVRSFGFDAGLSTTEANWLESLFVDPVRLGDQGYANGRHRTEACRAAGVTHLVVDTRSQMAAAIKRSLLVRSGAPLLPDIHEPAPEPAAPRLAEPGLAL